MQNPKLVVMYYGRFQPPHLGHIAVYKKIAQVFGGPNVYIGTSNKTDAKKSPLSFQWKQKLLRTMGVPTNRILQTKKNYNAEEVVKLLGVDPENTVWICAVGEKDGQRLAKYFDKYKKGMDLEPMSEKAYYYVIPNVKMGGKVMSATDVRAVLRKDELGKKDYDYLKQAIGASRAQVDNLVPLFEGYEDDNDLIVEGGQAGHMNHPYDDRSMTFSDMEKMIDMALSGELSREEITEKVDGQNLFGSMIKGKLRLARNKTMIKNQGAQSMTIPDMAKKWKDKPDVAQAFVEGAKALEVQLSKLSKDDQLAIFGDGTNWINFEVIWNVNKNVLDYDRDVIVMHNVNVIDDKGNVIGLDSSAQGNLFGKINQFNSQKKSNVATPMMMKVRKDADFSKKKKAFISKLAQFRSKQKIGKSATLGMWMDRFWEKKIRMQESKLNHPLKKATRDKIIRRFTDWNKSYKLTQMKKDIEYAPLFNSIRDLDKNHAALSKEATMPLELLFLELGVEVLQNVEQFLTANPDKTLDSLRKDISSKISQIRTSKDVADLEKMRVSLKKIQAIGGFNKLVPSEGIVFKFNGKVYKLTGLYAPVNQLMGLGRFER